MYCYKIVNSIYYILWKGRGIMAPLAAIDMAGKNSSNYGCTEQNAFDALYQELAKGVQSMKMGEVYTVEEAWEEIDKI